MSGPWQTCEECGKKFLGYYKMKAHIKTHPGLETRQRIASISLTLKDAKHSLAYYQDVRAALDGQSLGPHLRERLEKEWENGGVHLHLDSEHGIDIDPITYYQAEIERSQKRLLHSEVSEEAVKKVE